MKTYKLGSVSLAVACAACGQPQAEGTEFGKVSLNLTLSNDGSSDSTQTAAVGIDAGATTGGVGTLLTAKSALAFVRHVEFYKQDPACHSDGGSDCEDKIRVEGPWVIDLMTGASTPSVEIEVPAGGYRRVDVRFEDADKNAAKGLEVPDSLSEWTLVASGDYAGVSATQFDMRLKFNGDARFSSDTGINVSSNGTQEMFMALDLQRWFSAVSLDECFAKDRLDVVDDVLVIEDESRRCNAVENAIKEAMKHPHRLAD